MTTRRPRGTIRPLPSGRFRASYTHPPGSGTVYPAPHTFTHKGDAQNWIDARLSEIVRGVWVRPGTVSATSGDVTFEDHAEAWLAVRTLKPRTVSEYRKMLDGYLLPVFGSTPLREITPESVDIFYASMKATPSARSHTYALLSTIMRGAVRRRKITDSPCQIEGGGASPVRVHDPRPITPAELDVMVEAVPSQWRAALLILAWCGLRFGELAELRRSDVVIASGKATLRITRGVTCVDGALIVGPPKSRAGTRSVSVPGVMFDALVAHLANHVASGDDALLFPAPGTGKQLRSDGALHRWFKVASAEIDRPDLRVHDMRHTSATWAAASGASVPALMSRYGWTTATMAMHYAHAADGGDDSLAANMAALAAPNVVALDARRK